jgi:hypothetical protein
MKQMDLWIFLLVFFSLFELAFGADARPPEPMALLAEFEIFPGKTTEYEEIAGKFMSWYREHGLPYSILCHAMNDGNYFYLIPLKKAGDLDGWRSARNRIIEKVGHGEWNKSIARESGCYSQYSCSLLQHCPDISLTSKNRKYSLEKIHYTYWCYYHVIPGREAEFRAAFRKIIEYYHTLDFKGIDYGWDFYEFVIGKRKPVYLMIHPGQDVVDFWEQAGKRHALAGKELDRLFDRVLKTLRSNDINTGYYLPELSRKYN